MSTSKRRTSVSPKRNSTRKSPMAPDLTPSGAAWKRSAISSGMRLGRTPNTPQDMNYLALTLENVFLTSTTPVSAASLRLRISVSNQIQFVDPIDSIHIKQGGQMAVAGNLIKFDYPTITFGVMGRYTDSVAHISMEHVTRGTSGKVSNPTVIGKASMLYSDRFMGQYEMKCRGFSCGHLAAVMEVMEESYFSDDASQDSCDPPTPSPVRPSQCAGGMLSPLVSPQLREASQRARMSSAKKPSAFTEPLTTKVSTPMQSPVRATSMATDMAAELLLPTAETVTDTSSSLAPDAVAPALEARKTSPSPMPAKCISVTSPLPEASSYTTNVFRGTPQLKRHLSSPSRADSPMPSVRSQTGGHPLAVVAMMVLQYMAIVLPIVALLFSPTGMFIGGNVVAPVDASIPAVPQMLEMNTVVATIVDTASTAVIEAAPAVVIASETQMWRNIMSGPVTAFVSPTPSLSRAKVHARWGEHFACCV